MSKSQPEKPKKPSGSPLTVHPNGQWSKKHKRQPHYFGPWDDYDAALEKFNHDWPHILKGETPPPMGGPDAVTVRDLANLYIGYRRQHVDTGELSFRTWHDYKDAANFVVDFLGARRAAIGLTKADFARLRAAALKQYGNRIGTFVNMTKTMFRYAVDPLELMPHLPNFGRDFVGLSKARQRELKHARGAMMFEPGEVVTILKGCPMPLRAMVLLGLNAGFGNADCAELPIKAIDFENESIDFPRPKTHIERRVSLWPETVAALREAIATRPKPKNPVHDGLVFITKYGNPWICQGEKVGKDGKVKPRRDDAVGQEFTKRLNTLKLKRKGSGFYSLRHTFRTYADEARDDKAVNLIMGHASETMGDHYVERREYARLRKVVDLVRDKLSITKANLSTEYQPEKTEGDVKDDADAPAAA